MGGSYEAELLSPAARLLVLVECSHQRSRHRPRTAAQHRLVDLAHRHDAAVGAGDERLVPACQLSQRQYSALHGNASSNSQFDGDVLGDALQRGTFQRTQQHAVAHRQQVAGAALGDVAVAIAISTAHRKESFEACQYVIDTLKQTVPIWKREFFEDGDTWVSAHP